MLSSGSTSQNLEICVCVEEDLVLSEGARFWILFVSVCVADYLFIDSPLWLGFKKKSVGIQAIALNLKICIFFDEFKSTEPKKFPLPPFPKTGW